MNNIAHDSPAPRSGLAVLLTVAALASGCEESRSDSQRDAGPDASSMHDGDVASLDDGAPIAPDTAPDASERDALAVADVPSTIDARSDVMHDVVSVADVVARDDSPRPMDLPVVADIVVVADVTPAMDVPAAMDAPRPPDSPSVTDGGAPGAWELVGDFANGLWQWGHLLAVAPDATLYLARVNTGVYRGVLRDGRYTFTLLPNAGLTNLGFSALSVNDLGEPLLGCAGPTYGSTGPGTLFRFNPGASTWSAAVVPARAYTRNVTDFYLAPDGSTYVTGGWAALLLRSTDHGSTYTTRFDFDTVRPGTYYGLLFSIAVGPDNEMIVGAETESFQRSFNDGLSFTALDTATWLQRGNPYGAGFTQSGEGLFSRAIDSDSTKIYRRDRARGWVRADSGLERDPINTAPVNGWISNIVLAPWGENFVATLATVYRARNGGAWVPFTTGIDTATYGAYPNAIVADGRCVYAALRPVAPRTDIGAIYRYCGR